MPTPHFHPRLPVLALLLLSPAVAFGGGKPFVQRVPGSDVSFEMLPVPGGVFRMGSPEGERGRTKDEGPQVEVEVEPFHMGKFEVTWPEYRAFADTYHRVASRGGGTKVPADKFADAVTYPTPLYELEVGPILDRMGRGKGFPAISMSHFAARQYTKWLSKKTGRFYRLPTEAEWEYACRAGTTTAYSFGDDAEGLNDHGWYFDNSEDDKGDGAYRGAGRRKPNAWGLYDMHGNVGEWCVDGYSPHSYARFAGRKVKAADVINWSNGRYPRVVRGGGWESDARDCRSAARAASSPEFNFQDPDFPKSPHWEAGEYWVGFRVVSPAKAPPEAEKRRFWNAEDRVTIDVIKRDREIHELIDPAGRKK